MSTLAVADNADNTGAVATISGSAGGSNTVYTLAVSGDIGAASWVASGTRTGDGTVSLSLAKGYYWAYCLTAPATLSGLVYFAVTDGAEAVADRCFSAVKSRLQLLDLPFTQRVYDVAWADDVNVTYPLTVMTAEEERQSDEAAMNNRDDWGYPVKLLIRDRGVLRDEDALKTFRKWRQSVSRAFQNQRLPGVIESVRCKVEPGAIFRRLDGVDHLNKVVETELLIRCITREVRGLGA